MNNNYAIFQKKSNMNMPKFVCKPCANFGTFWSCVSFKLSPHGSVPGLFVQDPVQALVKSLHYGTLNLTTYTIKTYNIKVPSNKAT